MPALQHIDRSRSYILDQCGEFESVNRASRAEISGYKSMYFVFISHTVYVLVYVLHGVNDHIYIDLLVGIHAFLPHQVIAFLILPETAFTTLSDLNHTNLNLPASN